ncbi:MAG: pantoate--beta-alanine ligase [Elusimicrobia bacterium]|nr:pantoate--beta-alanine ligase [Elusimicrobiota bacterium]
MKVIGRRAEMAALSDAWRRRGLALGFVPTMGALHEGHAALIRRARRQNKRVAVSIFVNPAQFGPKEDLSRYPRPFAADRRLCERLGVDALYHPSAREVYPKGVRTTVEVQGLSDLLCGAVRPGHFKGVATVVLKLFVTVRPSRAYFGEKDFQQLQIVRRMVRDLDLPVEIVGCPTVRDGDGLALSSRNAYLSPFERAVAPKLHQALRLGARLARKAGTPLRLLREVRRELLMIPGATIDYVSVVDPASLEDARRLKGRLRLLTAVRVGKTRLIDNIALSC